MDSSNMLKELETYLKGLSPSVDIRFKDESLFMKALSRVMFFNKGFMTDYITTIGAKVYFPTRARYEANPLSSFCVLAHEGVHIVDGMKKPIRFPLGYLFPQILAVLALNACFAFLSLYFLFFLFALLFLAPIPAPFRKATEMRGYGMSIKVLEWLNMPAEYKIDGAAANFTGSGYYFMWPFPKSVKQELTSWLGNDTCLNEPIFKKVYDITKS